MTLNYIFKLYLGPLRFKMVENLVLKDDFSDILAVNGPKKQFKLSELKEIDMP